MFFNLLNKSQRTIAAFSVLVLGIVQIALDSWTLYKIQEHEQIIIFLVGNRVSSTETHKLTYDQGLSYLYRLKGFLKEDLLEILDTLQMSTVLGLVAGILQLFSSSASVMWKGVTVDIFWLVINTIVSILLSVAVSYIALTMIRDVPYHQILLTVTSVNLFILVHIWVLNAIALRNSTCSKAEVEEEQTSPEDANSSMSSRRNSSSGRTIYSDIQINTQGNSSH